MERTIRTCSKCILPETYPGISFNEDGVCNFCLTYQPLHPVWGRNALKELLESKPKAGACDCVVPLSGGKDSTFILYYVVKELGLSPIAVMHNSGFQHELALTNARNACTVLGVPLREVDTSGRLRRTMLKESLRVSTRIGEFWHPCGNCEAILRTVAIETARAYGTPFIIWGSSALESGAASNYLEYKNLEVRSESLARYAARKIARKLIRLASDRTQRKDLFRLMRSYVGMHALSYACISIIQRLKLGFPLSYALRPHAVPPFENGRAVFVHFFDYIGWDSLKTIPLLEQELGWKHPPDKETRWDCALHCLGNYDNVRMYGISVEGVNSCNFIREEKMTREAALEKERGILGTMHEECRAILNELKIGRYRMPPLRASASPEETAPNR
ncbi:MAG: hypothetical protein ACM3Q4_14705 [Acidobacteriota bacterium]